jgi:hypothetical protein
MGYPLREVTRPCDHSHVFHGSLSDDTESNHGSRLCDVTHVGRGGLPYILKDNPIRHWRDMK